MRTRHWRQPVNILAVLVMMVGLLALPGAGVSAAAAGGLTITKTTSTPTAGQGEIMKYAVQITNNGAGPLSKVAMTDPLPAIAGMTWSFDTSALSWSPGLMWQCVIITSTRMLTCDIPTLNPGEYLSMGVQATVPAGTTCQMLNNTASLIADGVSAVSSDQVSIRVACPELSIAFSTITPAPNAGDSIALKVSVMNTGKGAAANVVIDQSLPYNGGSRWDFDWTNMDLPGGSSCSLAQPTPAGPGSVHCTIPSLDPGITAVVGEVATVNPGMICTTLTSSASTAADQVSAIQAAPVSIAVTCPDLTITKHHAGDFLQGQKGAQYSLTVSNVGDGTTAGPVTVVDSLPAGLTATKMTGSGWTCTLASLTCTRSDALAKGRSYLDITVTVNVDPQAPKSLVNTAAVSGGGDASPGNNTASDLTNVNPLKWFTWLPAVLTMPK